MTAVYDTPEGAILREFESLATAWTSKAEVDVFILGPNCPTVTVRRAAVLELQDLGKVIWSRLNHRRKAEERSA